MSKARKTYSLDRIVAKSVNLNSVNPTVRAILKGLWSLTKDEDYSGMTGDQILEYCVENNLWSTKQDREKYITTWAYYVKSLKTLGVTEAGYTNATGVEEYLED